MGDVLLLIEIDDEIGEISSVSFELLGIGRKLSRETGKKLLAAIIGYGLKRYSEEIAKYVDGVYVIENFAKPL